MTVHTNRFPILIGLFGLFIIEFIPNLFIDKIILNILLAIISILFIVGFHKDRTKQKADSTIKSNMGMIIFFSWFLLFLAVILLFLKTRYVYNHIYVAQQSLLCAIFLLISVIGICNKDIVIKIIGIVSLLIIVIITAHIVNGFVISGYYPVLKAIADLSASIIKSTKYIKADWFLYTVLYFFLGFILYFNNPKVVATQKSGVRTVNVLLNIFLTLVPIIVLYTILINKP